MSISPTLRFEVFKKYNFTCQYCGRKSPDVILELDHVVPKVEGGDDREENLTCSCWECNRGKGGRHLGAEISDNGILEQTLTLAEYEIRMREYLAVAERCKIFEDTIIGRLETHFLEQFDYVPRYLDFPGSLILKALKIVPGLTESDIRSSLTYAVTRTKDDRRDQSWAVAACKYFCGIMKNQIKKALGED